MRGGGGRPAASVIKAGNERYCSINSTVIYFLVREDKKQGNIRREENLWVQRKRGEVKMLRRKWEVCGMQLLMGAWKRWGGVGGIHKYSRGLEGRAVEESTKEYFSPWEEEGVLLRGWHNVK